MAVTLRDSYDVRQTDEQARLTAEAARAANMNALNKAYSGGLVNLDINAARADEASARAAGRMQEADALAARAQELQGRAAMYTPDVGRWEDIRSLGDAGSFIATQMGQGAASMRDPLALSALGEGVSTATRFVPGLKGVSAIPRLLGHAGAFGLNARQMKGEYYGGLRENPDLRGRLTPEEENQQATVYGLGAGALESIVPGLAGRSLGGAALRRGVTQGTARAAPYSAGGRLLRDLNTEGLTEVAQGGAKQWGYGRVNPNRDTTEDVSDLTNSYLGGFFGGAPVAGAGALAEGGYRRIGDGADRVKDAAGSVVDMTTGAVNRAGEALGQAADRAREVGLKGVIDLGVEKGRPVWEAAKEKLAPHEQAAREALNMAQAEYQRFRLDKDEADLLNTSMPDGLDDASATRWVADNDARTMDYLGTKLEQLAAEGEPQASELLAALDSDDSATVYEAMDQARNWLLERNDYVQMTQKAAQQQESLGRFIQRGAKMARGAAMAGARGAAFVGKNVAEGMRQESKKNLQGAGFQTLDYDTWKAWRDENHPAPLSEAGSTHAIQRAAEGRRRTAERRGEVPVKADPEAAARSRERATLFAEILAAEANTRRARLFGHSPDMRSGTPDWTNYIRSIGYELEDMAGSWQGRQGRQPTAQESAQMGVATSLMDTMAEDLNNILGAEEAGNVVSRMARQADPAQAPFFEFLQDRVDGWKGNRGERAQNDQALQDQMLALLPQARQAELRESGGAAMLLDTVKEISRGRVDPARRREIEKALGADKLNGMLSVFGSTLRDPRALPETVIDDRGDAKEAGDPDLLSVNDDGEVVDENDAFTKRQAEKSVRKGAGPSAYNFARAATKSARTPTQLNPDPFAADRKTGKRPTLFRPGSDNTAFGAEALAKKIADVRALHENTTGTLEVQAKTLAEAFQDLGYTEAQQLTLFADYLRQEQLVPNAQALATEVEALRDGALADQGAADKIRKNLAAFAGRRSVVVAEQGTERMPLEMSHGVVVSLGRGGDAAMDAIRKEALAAGKRGTPAYNQARDKAMSASNLLVFRSAGDKNVMGRTGGDDALIIPADRLVKWVRNRGTEEGSTRTPKEGTPAHERYLNDLLEGISSLLGSGYAEQALPTMRGADGKDHSFADGLPPDLRLGMRKVSSFQADALTAKDLEEARVQRLKNWRPVERNEIAHQRELAEDQTADPLGKVHQRGEMKDRVTTRETADGKMITTRERVLARPEEDRQTASEAAGKKGLTDEHGAPESASALRDTSNEREDLAHRSTRKAADLFDTKSKPQTATARFAADSDLRQLNKDRPGVKHTPLGVGQRSAVYRATSRLSDVFGQHIAGIQVALMDDEKAAGRFYGEHGTIALHPKVFAQGVPALKETVEQRLVRVMAHELAHARDQANGHESEKYASLRPGGAAYNEARAAMDRDPVLAKWFGYIMDPTLSEGRVARELYAQLYALHLSRPELMNAHLPKSKRAVEADIAAADRQNQGRVAANGRSLGDDGAAGAGVRRQPAAGGRAGAGTRREGVTQTAAPKEVAADESPKSQPRPVGAIAKAAAFRKERDALLKETRGLKSQVDVQSQRIADQAMDPERASTLEKFHQTVDRVAQVREDGGTIQQALDDPQVQKAVAELMTARLRGSEAAAYALRSLQHAVDQFYALPLSASTEAAVRAAVMKPGATLDTVLAPLLQAGGFSTAVARAVTKVAGKVPVAFSPNLSAGTHGEYDTELHTIRLHPTLARGATALHEGVHAATVDGMVKDQALHRAVYDLMDHILGAEPELASAYGMSNSLEFLAEGMSNARFQARLRKIPASAGIRKYLGENVANAWDAFVAVVRKALGLVAEHESALSQLLELGGRAMVTSAHEGAQTFIQDEFGYRGMVPRADVDRRVGALLAEAKKLGMTEKEMAALRASIAGAIDGDKVPFAVALGIESGRRMLPVIRDTQGLTEDSVMNSVIQTGLLQGPLSLPSTTDGAGRTLTNQTTEGKNDDAGNSGPSLRRITRLANDRRASLANELRSEGVEVYSRPVRFGPHTLGATRQYFVATPSDVHSAVVPGQLHALVQRQLANPRFAGRAADVLNYFAVQRATYNRETGEFLTFGPDDASFTGAQVLDKLGLLGVARAPGVDRPMYRVEGVSRRETEEFLANHLAYTKNVLGRDEIPVKWERQTGANPGRVFSGVFNAQRVTDRPVASDEEVQAAKEYVKKTLGTQVQAEFEEITDFSGEWIDAENTIRVSTLTGAGTMNVARHEALHAFYSKFAAANPRARRVLATLTDDPRVVRRLQALLKDDPVALAQLADGEERLAYIHQFAMAGVLKLPHTPGTTLMAKVRKFLRRVFQMVSDQERAVSLLYSFEAGNMSTPSSAAKAVQAALDQGTWATKGARKLDRFTQRFAALTLTSHAILTESVSPAARELGRDLFANPGDGSLGDGKKNGYLNARNQNMRKFHNLFRGAINQLSDQQMTELIEAMQTERASDTISDPDVAEAKQRLHTMFEDFHRYLSEESGLRLGKIRKGYFPVVWDTGKLTGDPKAFKDMLLTKYGDQMRSMAQQWNRNLEEGQIAYTAASVADELYRRITNVDGVEQAVAGTRREDGVLRPVMVAAKERTLNFIKSEDRAPFLEKNLVETLSRYVRQGVRTAEYSGRFGRQGALLNERLKTIKSELEAASHQMLAGGELKDEKARADWARRQYRDVANAVGAIEGSLGSDVKDWQRKANSWAIVYQNVRVLPLALFASFVDPLGIAARGGEMREAWTAFMDGMKAVASQWGDMIREEPAQRQKTEWEALAEHAGIIDSAVFSHLLADEYGSMYLDSTTKKINETMFKANGMEAWNRAMRVAATRSAVNFIERHAAKPSEHSARWLNEIGLSDVKAVLDADGRLITNREVMAQRHPDMSAGEIDAMVNRVHTALGHWVESAIISPNAAQRPAWGSDPHYSMFWHLKQFAYSFHTTIMRRAWNEAKFGNMLPMGVLAWYIPTMIAADVTKGLMTGAGQLPGYMKGYDLGDWMQHGVERAGLLGVGQIAADAVQHPTSLGGPMLEQITDLYTEPIEKIVVRALPANSLYARALL